MLKIFCRVFPGGQPGNAPIEQLSDVEEEWEQSGDEDDFSEGEEEDYEDEFSEEEVVDKTLAPDTVFQFVDAVDKFFGGASKVMAGYRLLRNKAGYGKAFDLEAICQTQYIMAPSPKDLLALSAMHSQLLELELTEAAISKGMDKVADAWVEGGEDAAAAAAGEKIAEENLEMRITLAKPAMKNNRYAAREFQEFVGTETGWLIRIGPVSDRFQTSFRPVSDQCRMPDLRSQSMSQSLSSPMPVHVTVSHVRFAESTCRMHRTRSVMSDLRSVISDLRSLDRNSWQRSESGPMRISQPVSVPTNSWSSRAIDVSSSGLRKSSSTEPPPTAPLISPLW